MSSTSWRDARWATLEQPWDVLVIGGGITGAAILYEAARAGLRVLLIEARDFAWGTSSRSTKLVHGGFRYLTQGQVRTVRDSARQRRQLLQEWPGLVEPLGFTLAHYQGDRPAVWLYQLGLALYDLMAGQWDHQRYDPQSYGLLVPHVRREGLVAGLRCVEATTDDARLVLRLITEGMLAGGTAMNYVSATSLLREGGTVIGARLHDSVDQRDAEARARVVINATGAWADQLRGKLGAVPRLRPLRGSHLVFPAWRFPVAQVVAFRHPHDQRYMSVVPWEDVTLVGTTDLDHRDLLADEPAISGEEVAYLMAGVTAVFPALQLGLGDIVATFSGVRPVVSTGQVDPSKEARDHLVVVEQGMVTVTGGKLTTFRLLAQDALAAAGLGRPISTPHRAPAVTQDASLLSGLSEWACRRLQGRHGATAATLMAAAQPGELERIPGSSTLWAELRWAARAEWVVHLEDLLLRRVRLGIQLPEGGRGLLPQIRRICQQELGWDDERWHSESAAYQDLWRRHYSPPDPALVPDWHTLTFEEQAGAAASLGKRLQKRRVMLVAAVTAVIGACAASAGWRLLRQHRPR
jgi:glycerol-3-phosphate dehydrogenase